MEDTDSVPAINDIFDIRTDKSVPASTLVSVLNWSSLPLYGYHCIRNTKGEGVYVDINKECNVYYNENKWTIHLTDSSFSLVNYLKYIYVRTPTLDDVLNEWGVTIAK